MMMNNSGNCSSSNISSIGNDSNSEGTASVRPPESALPAPQHHVESNRTRFLGVTPPVSTAPSSEYDSTLSAVLLASLEAHGLFEPPEEAAKRERVLGRLFVLVKEFVKLMAMKGGLPEELAVESGGTIVTFGSYRLGVHGTGADIDTLCVVPRHVTREDFFDSFYRMLKGLDCTSNLAAVPDAYVPVIKMEFEGIPIDLLFARLNLPQVFQDLDLSDNNILRNLDERDVRSLNGSRVTDAILRLVPDVGEFRIALRCIKLWAKRKAIYSNVMGFLGGVAWAMLVARVCQLYPNACASTIVAKFFMIMDKWDWPQPVLLKPIEEGPLNVRIWNPKLYPTDKQHRMPIITPAYPSMCSTHNVTVSTHKIMDEEFREASTVAHRIMLGTCTWDALFTRHNFFRRYKHYLQLVASSKSHEMHLCWSGLVESRIRQMVMKLELVDGITLAHPFIEGRDRHYLCPGEEMMVAVQFGMWPSSSSSSTSSAFSSSSSLSTFSSFSTGCCARLEDLLQIEKEQEQRIEQKEVTGTEKETAKPHGKVEPQQQQESEKEKIEEREQENKNKTNVLGKSIGSSSSTSTPTTTISSSISTSTLLTTVKEEESKSLLGKATGTPVYTTSFYIGLQIQLRQATPSASTSRSDIATTAPPPRRQLDISWPTREFIDLLKSWDSYDSSKMMITIQNLKRSLLPADLMNDDATIATTVVHATAGVASAVSAVLAAAAAAAAAGRKRKDSSPIVGSKRAPVQPVATSAGGFVAIATSTGAFGTATGTETGTKHAAKKTVEATPPGSAAGASSIGGASTVNKGTGGGALVLP